MELSQEQIDKLFKRVEKLLDEQVEDWRNDVEGALYVRDGERNIWVEYERGKVVSYGDE